ncbi:response regulator transcription factor [Undibacterium luofuense]|uniref:Response regulator transcription factor n=1 Tax=Undibacterium luofuense TaxID=2828733 RepID=A0A941I981_9BURK|nr:response regulator transcription factor [Undibacterium luofuense]MBR7783563.1 response regulator transcription factor [Undibacterium luofuense]
MNVKIGIVEDNPRTLNRFSKAISEHTGWHCAFACSRLADAMQLIHEHSIDVLLLDLGLPDGAGIDLIPFTLRRQPACQILIISVFGDEENVIRCVEAGASGYLLKGQGDDDLAEHLQDLLNGGSPMSPQIARRVLKQLRQYASPAPVSGNGGVTESALNDLTSKELEILKDLAIGHTYSEVAANLHISLNTVRHHVKSIYSKLYVNSRTQAINTAARLGLL